MIINTEQIQKSLRVSYFDKEGNVAFKNLTIPETELYEWTTAISGKKDPYFKSWDGKPVQRKKNFYLNKYRIEEFLLNQPKEVRDEIHQFNMPKKFFVDIEIMNDEEWPKPAIARHAITLISISHKNLLIVLGTKPLTTEQIKTIEGQTNEYLATKGYPPIEYTYIYFKTEYDMLYTFFNKWVQKMPVITGWNFVKFDWAYMVKRCENLGIDASVASPSKKLVGNDLLPLHRVVVDYLEIYAKWDRVIFKENNTLEYVSTAATGLGKIKYNGTLAELHETDFPKYCFYGGVDAVLVNLIDEKISTFTCFLKLAHITGVECLRTFSPIALTECVITKIFYKRGFIFPALHKQFTNDRGSYEGAYVFSPIKGIYEWVSSFDFASLYPSIIRQWNMSIENYVDKVMGQKNDNNELSITASSARFLNTGDSVFREMLTDYFGQRKKAKRTGEDVEAEINLLKKYKKNMLQST